MRKGPIQRTSLTIVGTGDNIVIAAPGAGYRIRVIVITLITRIAGGDGYIPDGLGGTIIFRYDNVSRSGRGLDLLKATDPEWVLSENAAVVDNHFGATARVLWNIVYYFERIRL